MLFYVTAAKRLPSFSPSIPAKLLELTGIKYKHIHNGGTDNKAEQSYSKISEIWYGQSLN